MEQVDIWLNTLEFCLIMIYIELISEDWEGLFLYEYTLFFRKILLIMVLNYTPPSKILKILFFSAPLLLLVLWRSSQRNPDERGFDQNVDMHVRVALSCCPALRAISLMTSSSVFLALSFASQAPRRLALGSLKPRTVAQTGSLKSRLYIKSTK